MTAIKPGQPLPSLEKGPVKVRHLAMFASATAEFVDIHYDKDYALRMGLPDIIIQGLYKTATIAQMLQNWLGENQTIERLNVRHVGMDVAGNTLTAGGVVKSVDGHKIVCDVWIDNQLGNRTVTGEALISLPR